LYVLNKRFAFVVHGAQLLNPREGGIGSLEKKQKLNVYTLIIKYTARYGGRLVKDVPEPVPSVDPLRDPENDEL